MSRKPTIELHDLITRLGPVVYPTLRKEYTPDCCIAAAAILLRVFDHYGYKARVVPVSVGVYNARMVKLIEGGVQIPTERRQRDMWFHVTGAYGIGIMPQSAVLSALNNVRGGGYGGHLLVRVGRYLVDATIQQVNRPEKNVEMPSMIVTPHADILEQTRMLSLAVGACHVVYQRIDDESYRTAPDWTRRSTPVPETVRAIIAGVDNDG